MVSLLIWVMVNPNLTHHSRETPIPAAFSLPLLCNSKMTNATRLLQRLNIYAVVLNTENKSCHIYLLIKINLKSYALGVFGLTLSADKEIIVDKFRKSYHSCRLLSEPSLFTTS